MIISSANAQETTPSVAVPGGAVAPDGATPPAGFDIVSLMPLLLIFMVFYFLLIRPQQKRMKEEQDMREALKIGDEVVTAGGLIGKVRKIDGEKITLEVAKDVKVTIMRVAINACISESSIQQDNKKPAKDVASKEKKKKAGK